MITTFELYCRSCGAITLEYRWSVFPIQKAVWRHRFWIWTGPESLTTGRGVFFAHSKTVPERWQNEHNMAVPEFQSRSVEANARPVVLVTWQHCPPRWRERIAENSNIRVQRTKPLYKSMDQWGMLFSWSILCWCCAVFMLAHFVSYHWLWAVSVWAGFFCAMFSTCRLRG